jgi:arylformamidase
VRFNLGRRHGSKPDIERTESAMSSSRGLSAGLLLCLLTACRAAAAPPPQGVTAHRDIAYATVEGVEPGLLSLDLYAREGAKGAPILIYVHGGGWKAGDKANQMEHKPAFFTGAGFLFVSLNYRLSPAVAHPTHARDVAKAIAWVHKNAARYGGDPGRMYLMGHSAGAHLVALVGTDPKYLGAEGIGLDALDGVIALDGAGYDIPTHMAAAGERQVKELYLTAFGEDPAVWKEASPISYVAAGKQIPPFLLVYAGERRASRLQALALAEALTAAGVPSKTFHAAGDDHASVNRGIGAEDNELSRAIVEFLQPVSR